MRRYVYILIILLFWGYSYGVSEKAKFMLSKDIEVIEQGSYDAKVRWGGKEIKISELSNEWGPGATRRLWRNMNNENKFKLIKSYQSFFYVPKNLSNHFSQEVTHEIYQFYNRRKVFTKIKEKAATRRVDDMLSDNIKKAQQKRIPSIGDAGLKNAELSRLVKEMTQDVKDLNLLLATARKLEAEKLGQALMAATEFGVSQLVGFVTGGVYNVTNKMSELVGEILKQAADRAQNAMNTNPTPDQIVKLNSELQHIYLKGCETLATRIIKNSEQIEKIIKEIEEKETEKQEKEKNEIREKVEKKKESANEVRAQSVSVTATYEKDDKREERERKLAWAAYRKLQELTSLYYRTSSEIYSEALPTIKKIFKNDEQEELKKNWIGIYRYWNDIVVGFGPGYIDNTMEDYDLKGLKEYMKQAEKSNDALQSYGAYNNGIQGDLEDLYSNAVSKLQEREALRRGLWNNYGGLIRKYIGVGFTPFKVGTDWSINSIMKGISSCERIDQQITNIDEKAKDSIEEANKLYSKMRSKYKAIQSRYGTLSDNLYLAIEKLSQKKQNYFSLMEEIGVSTEELKKSKWNSYNVIYKGIKDNYIGEVKELINDKKFDDAAQKLEKLYSLTEKINEEINKINIVKRYVQQAMKEVDAFSSSIGYSTWYINKAIEDNELSGDLIKTGSQLFMEYSGGAYSLYYYLSEVHRVNPDRYFEGTIILKSAVEYNEKMKEYLEKKQQQMNSVISSINLRNAVYGTDKEYENAVNGVYDRLYKAMPYYWIYLKEFIKENNGYEKWLNLTRMYMEGHLVPDILSEDNKKLYNKIWDDYRNFNTNGAIAKANQKRAELKKTGISITSAKINGKQLQYPVTTLENMQNNKVTISGSAFTGVKPDKIVITVNGKPSPVTKINSSIAQNGVISSFSIEAAIKQNEETTIGIMAYCGGYGNGPSYIVRALDRASIEKEVNQFYNEFVKNYQDADLDAVLDALDDNWTTSHADKYDVEQRLDNIFATFSRLDVKITNLQISPSTGKYYATARYHISIQGRLSEMADVTHKEEGDVVDYLIKTGQGIKIKKTFGKGFF